MYSASSPLAGFHPTLAGWFRQTFGEPTPVQREAWSSIAASRHTLIAAPTGSGKTLAALLPCLSRVALAKERVLSQGHEWPLGVRILYITPLKALNNDIQHHLLYFLEKIEQFGEEANVGAWPGLRTAVRTGDTLPRERARMANRPPETLVTTPESLYLLLTSDKGRAMLRTVETVIVDEIHNLAGDKRGAHLSLSLERLSALALQGNVQRIGVSATQKPLSRVARFLGGWAPGEQAAGDGAAVAAHRAGAAETRGARPLAEGAWEATANGAGHLSDGAGITAGGARRLTTGVGGTADTNIAGRMVDGTEAQSAPVVSNSAHSGSGSFLQDDEQRDSATHPLGYTPRTVEIVESAMNKALEVRVTMPDLSRPVRSREGVWEPIVERIMALMADARSVLLFVNSRRLCERLVLRLNEQAGYELARAHHGSLARERRLEVERMLKAGELRCLVATSSLELGIDVGHVDLVIQVDSPKAAAAGIQRIGRAGHGVGDVSRGFILARQRGELPEAAVLCRSIARRDIEAIQLPRAPLDVLSQQIVAMTAAGDMTFDGMYRLVAQSECYRDFPRERMEATLKVLSGFYPFARPLVEWDRETDLVRKRANTAMASVTGAGTIPSSSAYPVHHAESRTHLGELDEEYIAESRVGDVFQLGTSSWMISRIENDRVYVQEAPNRFSEIPFWRAESGSRSIETGVLLGEFLDALGQRLLLDTQTTTTATPPGRHAEQSPDEASKETKESDAEAAMGEATGSADADNANARSKDTKPANDHAELALNEAATAWLDAEYGLDRCSAGQLIDFVRSQHRALGLPTARRIIIEHYRDLMNQTRIIIHNPFGRRVNRTWLLAIQRQFQRLLPYSVYGNAKDNGIELVVPDWDASWLGTLWQINAAGAEPLLTEAIAGSPLLAVAFRRIAETSLLLSRSFTRTPMWQKRLRSEELLKQALPYAEHFPYLEEAMRECLHEALDTNGLKRLLEAIASGEIEIVVKETQAPSPFAVQFIADYANTMLYEGDGLSEATQLQLLGASKALAGQLFGEDAVRRAVDPVIAREEAARLETGRFIPANADELVQLLKQRGDMTQDEAAAITGRTETPAWLDALRESGRIVELDFGKGRQRWICAEERELYADFPAGEASIAFVAGRFADNRLSFTEAELRERYPRLSASDAARVADVLTGLDRIEHAPFAEDEERIWTSRNVAKRLVRLTLEHARKQAQALDPVGWLAHMSRLQHALTGTQVSGIDGLRLVIERLQGFFLPASHWETLIFPARVTGYRKEDLDLLCASGEVIWLGRKGETEKEGRIAFFLSEAKPLYAPVLKQAAAAVEVSKHPRLLSLLRDGGAAFLTKLSRDTGQLPSELLADLLDLVWEGAVSNDQFAPLRLQLATKGKQLARTGSGLGRWYWTGSLAEDDRSDEALSGGGHNGKDASLADRTKSGHVVNASGDAQDQSRSHERGIGVPGKDALRAVSSDLSESALHWTQHLLDSCGIVSKSLALQFSPFGWDELLPVLKQLEQWGVVTRGLLVAGTDALQFARREDLEAAHRALPSSQSQAVTVIAATDPANPFGLAANWPNRDGASFSRKSGSFLVLQQGKWRFWLENNGRQIVDLATLQPHADSDDNDEAGERAATGAETARSAAPDTHAEPPSEADSAAELAATLKEIFRTLLRQQKLSKIKIDRWNGAPVAESPAAELLSAMGAERDNHSFVIWPSDLR